MKTVLTEKKGPFISHKNTKAGKELFQLEHHVCERYSYDIMFRRPDSIRKLRETTGIEIPLSLYGNLQLAYQSLGYKGSFDELKAMREATGVEPSQTTIYCIKAELLRQGKRKELEEFDEITGVEKKVEVVLKYL